jgi:hypothetical protein
MCVCVCVCMQGRIKGPDQPGRFLGSQAVRGAATSLE